MNNPQTNKFSMYSTVKAVCDEFRDEVWKDHEAFSEHFAEFTSEISAIQAWKHVQESALDGVALTKVRLQDMLINEALPLAGALCAFAAKANNAELLTMTDLERTDFANMRDEDIDDFAMNLHAKAQEIIAAQPANGTGVKLRGYGVSDAMLAGVEASATAYQDVVNGPRLAKGKVRSATETIAEHFAVADDILDKKLDKLVRQFKKGHAEFLARYRNARQIVNVSATRTTAAPNPARVVAPTTAATAVPALARVLG